jgi:histidinol-phosphate aminotransferase
MRRRTPDNRVNLSSNELRHPLLTALVDECSRRIEAATWRDYFAAAPVIDDMSHYIGVPPSHFLVTPGSNAALRALCRDYMASASDAHVVLQFPNYPAWEAEASALNLPVSRISGHGVDACEQSRRLIEAVRTRMGCLIAISQPNGPTGRTMDASDLDELIEIAQRQRHLLVIDACYQAFWGSYTALLARHGDAVVVVQSLSKSHGLAGARVAIVAGSPAQVEKLGRGQIEEAVSGPSLLLAREMLSRNSEFESIWCEIVQLRNDAIEQLRGHGLQPVPSGGNFLAVDIGGVPAAAALAASLSQAGYRIRDLSNIPGLEGYVRFTIGDAETTQGMLHAWWATSEVSDLDAQALRP